jgi:hypothetical protein
MPPNVLIPGRTILAAKRHAIYKAIPNAKRTNKTTQNSLVATRLVTRGGRGACERIRVELRRAESFREPLGLVPL